MKTLSTTARLAGVVQSIPGVCTFVRPVFQIDDRKLCLQRIENGRIVGWDIFDCDSSVTCITSGITRSIGDAAIVAYETTPSRVVIGDLFSIAESLFSDEAELVSLKETSPSIYQAIEDFCEAVSDLTFPCGQEHLLEERDVPFPQFKDRLSEPNAENRALIAAQRDATSKSATLMGRLVNHYESVWHRRALNASSSWELENVVQFAQVSFAEELTREATFLLGQKLLAQKVVLEVFRKLREQLKIFAVAEANLSSVRMVFRTHLYETMCSARPTKDERVPKRLPIFFTNAYSTSGSSEDLKRQEFVWQSVNSSVSCNGETINKFNTFRAKHPQEACLFYWIYQDRLSLREICQTTEAGPEQAIELLRRGQKGLKECLFSEGFNFGSGRLRDIFVYNPSDPANSPFADKDEQPHSVKLLSYEPDEPEEIAWREIESIRSLMDGLLKSHELCNLNQTKGFPLMEGNTVAFPWRSQHKNRLN